MTNFTNENGTTIDFFQIDIREFQEQTVCCSLRPVNKGFSLLTTKNSTVSC